jgi:lysophospholipase L1-like esterase
MLLSLAMLEALTRLLVPSPLPWNWPQVRYDVSPSLGFRLKPNQVGYTADKPMQTNALGLRGPERSRSKPAGVRRVLILGDSIAFGHGVAYPDTFAQRLETLLNGGSGQGSNEVIDAGVPAFNTQQEVTYFREEGLLFQPDVAVLALYWNDISSKTGVTADSEGRLIDDATPVNPGWYGRWSETPAGFRARNLLKRSSFLYFVVDRLRYLRAGSERSTPKQAAMQQSVLTGTPHPAVTAGWMDIEHQLVALAELGRSHGIEVVVAILPMPQLLEGQYPNAQYPARVLGMCQRIGLRSVDIQPAFARAFKGHGSLFIPYDGDHPNERGHEIIADELYSVLRRSRTP